MPTYNCGEYIAQSVESVIAQTVTDWEIEIVDDCSTDNTAEVLKPYLEKYADGGHEACNGKIYGIPGQ